MGGLLSSGEGGSIVTDSDGYVYTAGEFQGTVDLDPGDGVSSVQTPTQARDVFLTKFDPAGEFVWARQIGGDGVDGSTDVGVDQTGAVYVLGTFQDTVDFDPGPGVFNLTSAGQKDLFVSKFDGSGMFLWAVKIGGAETDDGRAMAIDEIGNVYLTGSFQGVVDFDPGLGELAFATSPLNRTDIFVCKLDGNGGLIWAKQFGGSFNHSDLGDGIAVDGSGAVYTTGFFSGTVDFDPGPGVENVVGSFDIFISKLDGNGDFVWAKAIGGALGDHGRDVAVDVNGNLFVTGDFQDIVDFDPGAGVSNLESAGFYDAFVAKFTAGGDFLWARNIGGDTNHERGYGLVVDKKANVYVRGQFYDTVDFDPGDQSFELTSEGGIDIFVMKLDSDSGFGWAYPIGGSATDGVDAGPGLNVDRSGFVYATGSFGQTVDFDPGPEEFSLTAFSVGGQDAFVAKYDPPQVPSTTGVFRPSTGGLFLKSANETGFADILLTYGLPGDQSVAGDWNADGIDSVGIFRDGVFYLRNANTNGVADLTFAFGASSDLPIVGDWDGSGTDTVGIFRDGVFMLRNVNDSGPPDAVFVLGIPGDVPISGDWDGDGIDTVGVFRPATGDLFLKNENSTGIADITLTYGLPGDKPVTGDWDGDGVDTIGVFRGGVFHLRNSNTNGFADTAFVLGVAEDEPISGSWRLP